MSLARNLLRTALPALLGLTMSFAVRPPTWTSPAIAARWSWSTSGPPGARPAATPFPGSTTCRPSTPSRGLVVIGVNVDRERADADRFLHDVPAEFEIVYDPDGTLAARYDVTGHAEFVRVRPRRATCRAPRRISQNGPRAKRARRNCRRLSKRRSERCRHRSSPHSWSLSTALAGCAGLGVQPGSATCWRARDVARRTPARCRHRRSHLLQQGSLERRARLRRRRLRLQLTKEQRRLQRDWLAAATCALLGTGVAAPVQRRAKPTAGPSTRALLYYGESDDRVQDVSAAIAATRDFERRAQARLHPDRRHALTGASASGAIALDGPQTFTSPSGRAVYTTPAGEVPLDDTFLDTRFALNASWTQPLARLYTVSGRPRLLHRVRLHAPRREPARSPATSTSATRR